MTIRYGTYELEMFKPPVNLTNHNPVDKINSTLKVTIG